MKIFIHKKRSKKAKRLFKFVIIHLAIVYFSLGNYSQVLAQEVGNLVNEIASPSASIEQEVLPIPNISKPFVGEYELTRSFHDKSDLLVFPEDTVSTTSAALEELTSEVASVSATSAKLAQLEGEHGHNGIDFATPEATEILSVDEGVVVRAGEGEYGVTVILNHSWGESIYGHLSSVSVKEGENVEKGKVIGLSGSTGIVTGPHLHFGMKDSLGMWVDPEKYLGEDDEPLLPQLEDSVATSSAVLGEKIEEEPKETLLSSDSSLTDFQVIEDIEFNLEGEIDSIVAVVIEKDGVGSEVEAEIDVDSEGQQKLLINPPDDLEPGSYSLHVLGEQDILFSQDFTWGVLAINTHKSVYAPYEEANIEMAVLDDYGKMVCDAILTLKIQSPTGAITTLSTGDGTIVVNEECFIHGFTTNPDYEARYATAEAGEYQIELTAETGNGTRTVTDTLFVDDSVPFDVVRDSATRIFPTEPYPMTFHVTAREDFSGRVVETVPAGFDVLPPDDNSLGYDAIEEDGEAKRVIWNMAIAAGDDVRLGYRFDSPDISPQFFLAGPLVFEEIGLNVAFSEYRKWQMAIDATYTWDGGGDTGTCGAGNENNWSCPQNWSSDIVPGSSDIALFNGTSTKDATIDASFGGSVDGVSIASGYTGTIIQSRSLTIENSGFSQADGTWNGGAQTLDINDGSFTVSGGVHTATTGTWAVERDFTHSGGTLDMTGATVVFNGISSTDDSTLTCFGTLGGTVSIVKDANGNDAEFTLGSGCTVTLSAVDSQGPVIINGTASGTNMNLEDDLTIGSGGELTLSGTLTFDGIGGSDDSVMTCTGTYTGGTVSIVKDANGNDAEFTLGSGCTVTLSTVDSQGPVTINGTASGTNMNLEEDLTIGSGGSLTLSGTLTFDGIGGSDDSVMTCTGSFTAGAVSITKSDAGNDGNTTIGSGCTVTLSTVDTTGTVTIDGTASGTNMNIENDLTVGGSGSLSLSGTLTFDGNSSTDDTTVTCTGALALTTALAKTGDGDFAVASGCDLTISSTSGATNVGDIIVHGTLTINNSATDSVPIGDGSGNDLTVNGTLTIGSNVTLDINDASVSNAGTLNLDGNITLEGSFSSSSGTVVGSGIVTLDGGNDTSTITCSGTLGGIFNVSKSTSGGGPNVTLSSGCTVESTSIAGDIGTLIINGTLNHTGSTFNIEGHCCVGGFGNVTINNGGVLNYSGTNINVEGDFTIASGATFDMTGIVLTFDGDDGDDEDSVLTCTGTLAGTVNLAKSANGSFTLVSGCTINTTSINGAHGTITINGTMNHTGSTFNVDAHCCVNGYGNLVIGSTGTLDYSGTNITLEGGLNVASGATFDMTGITITLDGTGQSNDSTVTCSGTLGGTINFAKTSTGGGDVVLSSGCTINTTSISGNFGTITINGTMNHTGSTFNVDGHCCVGGWGNLTLNSAGTINYSGTNIGIVGDLSINGTWDLSGKTITFDDSSVVGGEDSTMSCTVPIGGNVVVNKDGGGNTFILGTDCTVEGDFTRTNGIISNPGSAHTLTVEGDFSTSTTDAFGGGNLTIQIGGTGNQTISQTAGTMSSVFEVNNPGSTVSLTTSFTTASTCNIIEGTFDVNGNNFTCGSTFTVEDGGTLELFGNETVSTPTLATGSTVIYTGDGGVDSDTYTIKDFDYYNLRVNSTDGSSDTFNLASNETIAGDLTFTAGTIGINGATTLDVTGVTTAGGATWNMGTLSYTGGGDFICSGGTVDAELSSFTASSDFNLSGCMFMAPSGTMFVEGDFARTGGTFTHNSGTVVFDGAGQEVFGSTTFHNLTKNVTSADTLTLPAGETQIVEGTWSMEGQDGAVLSLRSSTEDTQWEIDPQGTRTIAYLDVQDSNNINSTQIDTNGLNINNSGNNTGWIFNVGPNNPSSLGPTTYVDGSTVTSNTPGLSFTLSDSNPADQLRYRMQMSPFSDFSYISVDYTSALGAQGVRSFTVGQGTSGGSYAVGGPSQSLANGPYYWRVKAIDDTGIESGYTTANSGSMAFNVEIVSTESSEDSSSPSDTPASESAQLLVVVTPTLTPTPTSTPAEEREITDYPDIASPKDTTITVEDPDGTRIKGASVYVDGTFVGTTNDNGQITLSLSDGPHKVVAVYENQESKEAEIEVVEGEEENIVLLIGSAASQNETFVEEVISQALTSLASDKPTLGKGAVATAVVTASGISLFASVPSILEVLGLFTRLFSGLLAFFRHKKPKPWGIVYDSVTKLPIDPAIVSLYSGSKKIGDRISDIEGRFGFLVKKGIYHLTAVKTDYSFPSKKVTGTFDYPYNFAYHGEALNIENPDVVAVSIPMDPLRPNWNQLNKPYYSNPKREKWIHRIINFLVLVGLAYSAISFLFVATFFNAFILGVYVVALVLRLVNPSNKKWGYVLGQDGKALSFAVVKVFLASENHEVAMTVTDRQGRYYILIGPGTYYQTVEKKTEEGYEQIYKSENFTITRKKGIVDREVRV